MIRKAELKDVDKISKILRQVGKLHHDIRPDIFKDGTKYTDEEIRKIIKNDNTPVFVYVDKNGFSCFCFH